MVLRICKSFIIILSHLSLLCLCGKWNLMYCNVTGYRKQEANHVPLVARIFLLECVICFPCLSEYRHQPIPALHIPCTAWNITFISIICHFRYYPRLSLHNNWITSDHSAVQVRLAAGTEHEWVYANVGALLLVTPTVTSQSVWYSDSPIFQWSLHEIYIRRRKNGVWVSRYVISIYRSLIIQLCQGKYSFPFYSTYKALVIM